MTETIIAYRKKPVVIHAVQWTGDLSCLDPIWGFAETESVEQNLGDQALLIPTLEGTMRGEVGDWIICGVKGELYPCKPEVFGECYEPA